MQLYRWLCRQFSTVSRAACRLITTSAAFVCSLLRHVSLRFLWLVTGLALVFIGAWQVWPPAALLLTGFLLIRDAESPNPPAS